MKHILIFDMVLMIWMMQHSTGATTRDMFIAYTWYVQSFLSLTEDGGHA